MIKADAVTIGSKNKKNARHNKGARTINPDIEILFRWNKFSAMNKQGKQRTSTTKIHHTTEISPYK